MRTVLPAVCSSQFSGVSSIAPALAARPDSKPKVAKAFAIVLEAAQVLPE